MHAQTATEKPPENILRKLEELRKNFNNKVVLKRINGKYYAYKQSVKWIKETKKPKTNSEYLGRIYEDGAFAQKAVTHRDDLSNAANIITANGGKVTWPQAEEPKIPQEAGLAPSELDRRILMELSMDARVSLASLATKLNMKRSALYYRVRKLEGTYGIKYLLEIDTEKLGYLNYIMLMKFEEDVPESSKIKAALERVPMVQFAAMTSGDYDVVISFIVGSSQQLSSTTYSLRKDEFLGEFKSVWYLTPFGISYGFIPLRNQAFEAIKEKVWHRTKELIRPGPENITNREYVILKEMNENAAIDFTALDAKNSFDQGASQYTYYRLKEKGLIKRATITMQKLNPKYNTITLLEIHQGNLFIKSRAKLLQEIIRPSNYPTNTHSIVGDFETPDGAVLITPIFKESDLKSIEELRAISGTVTRTLLIKEIIVGKLCYRLYDNSTSKQAKRLREQYPNATAQARTANQTE
jgi:DNA-binding Lrp family transcriptional regulator